MQMPTIHFNGTNGRDLLEQYCEIGRAIANAIEKMVHNGPNGRDYYPLGPAAFSIAASEHEARIKKLREVREEIEQIAEHIADFV
jgi:hypothetical protein